jgi:phosphoglycolate phosphatase
MLDSSMNESCAAIFDLDGVLLDSESDLSWLQTASEKTLAHFNIDIEEYADLLYSKHVPNFLEVSKRMGINPIELWPVRNRIYTEEKLKAMKERIITPFSDMASLYDLQPFFELGIVSNSPQSVVDYFIQGYGYEDLFQFGIGRGDGLEDIQRMKPHPFLFSKIKTRINAACIFYIGDTDTDRLFAERTGMSYLPLDRTIGTPMSYSTLDQIVDFLLTKQVTKKTNFK